MKATNSHRLQMFLAANGFEPVKESGDTAYYYRTAALEAAL